MPAPVILVIEPNAVTRKMLRAALESGMYAVREAADANTALVLMSQGIPDLILQTFVLPDMDGFALTAKLRACAPDVPIVLLSSRTDDLDGARLAAADFSHRISKPVLADELLSVIAVYAPVPTDPHGGAVGLHVLLVDDDPMVLKLGRLVLAKAGFRVSTASSIAEAFERAYADAPHAIVSDVLMREGDGFDLCCAMRSDATLGSIPVVLVSVYFHGDADRALAMDMGASDLLGKTPTFRGVADAIVTSVKVGAPPLSERSRLERTKRTHTYALARRLEQQVGLTTAVQHRCALQAAQLAVLSCLADGIIGSNAFAAVTDDVLAACLDAGSISKGALYLGHPEDLVLQSAVGYGPSGVSTFFGHGDLLAAIVRGLSPVTLPSPAFRGSSELVLQAGVRHAHVVPLVLGDAAVGVLFLGSDTMDADSGEDVTSFARAVGSQIVKALAVLEVSERKKRLEASMKDAVVIRDNFLAIASHELRTPLTGMQLQCQMALRQLARGRRLSAERVARLLANTEKQLQRLDVLVSDMLDVARIDRGPMLLKLARIDLAVLVRQVLEQFSEQLRTAHCEVRLDLSRVMVMCDGARIEQVVLNLLSNAIRYAPGCPIDVALCADALNATLTIRDHGQGIPEENRTRIFERYERLVPKEESSGLGLGLYIAQGILAAHKGDIRVESIPGKSATFIVRLPLSGLSPTAVGKGNRRSVVEAAVHPGYDCAGRS